MTSLESLLETIRSPDTKPDGFAIAAKELALQSRESPETRAALASVLKYFLNDLRYYDYSKDVEASLRCAGNACISNLDACALVTESGFGWSHMLRDSRSRETKDLVAKVLYNVCSQSEEAQKECYRSVIHFDLLIYIDSKSSEPPPDVEALSREIDLLFWIIRHHTELGTGASMHIECTEILANLPSQYSDVLEPEDFATAVEAVLVMLRESETQKDMIDCNLLFPLWQVLEQNERKVHIDESLDDEERKLLTPLSTSLIWAFSDLAAHPHFVDCVRLDDRLLTDLIDFLSDERGEHRYASLFTFSQSNKLRTAACQMVGNLIHGLPAEDAVPLIRERNIHRPLFHTMLQSDRPDYLHTAAGLLVLLTRPSKDIRYDMAAAPYAFTATQKLGRHSMPQLKQDALALMRAMGKDAPEIQEQYKSLATEVMAAVAEAQSAQQSAERVAELPNGGSQRLISG